MFEEKLGALLNQHAKICGDKRECEADILHVLDDMGITSASILTDDGMVEVSIHDRRLYIEDLRQVIDCRVPKAVRPLEVNLPR